LATPESKVKDKVKRLLQPYTEMGVLWGDWPVPGGYGKSGLDYHGCLLGKYFAIETKAEGKEPTDRQKWTISRIQKARGTIFVIIGVNDPELQVLKIWLERTVRESR
jgi:hypothetical protein